MIFGKDFFKLMNKSVFGKTMENVKNRMELQLTAQSENGINLFSRLNCKDNSFSDGLHMIDMYKK